MFVWNHLKQCLCLIALVLSAAQVRAASSLRVELADVAKGIKQLLAGRDEEAIAVGAFTGPSHADASAGPGIAKTLSEELEKMQVKVQRRAALEVKGDYLDVQDKKTKLLAALLKVRVLDRQGTVIVEFERGVFGDVSVPTLFGLTVDLPPKENDKVRNDKIRESIDKPQAALSGNQVRADAKSPYAMEVMIQSGGDYAPRMPKLDDGRAFVPIKRGETYAVRLYNDSPYEAAVTLTIDGLSNYVFSDERNPQTNGPRYSKIVIEPKSYATIKGWYRNNEESDSFQVMEYAKSAAAELKSSGNIGTITACYAACWPKGSPPPPDEPPNPSESSRSGDATGRGARVQQKYVAVERDFGVVRSTVSVRYTK